MDHSQNVAGRTNQTANAALHTDSMVATERLADATAFIQHSANNAGATGQRGVPRRSASRRAPFCTANGWTSVALSDHNIVGQSSRRLEQDVGFDNIAGSASQQSLHLPTQLHLPPEVDFIGSNPGSKANSESTDSTEYGGSPRTAASRPVPQVIRAGATASVPDTSRPRCPSAPTSAEIRGNLTFLDDLPTPRERDVTATTAASTGELYYSASLADASAPETSADPSEATDASVATVYPRDQSPACASAASALPSGGGSDSRQGRAEDEECQIRVKHVTYCCICGRWPGDREEGTFTNVEAVFCGTCPRKFCLSCLNLPQAPDTLAWEGRFDSFGDFWRIPDGCNNCRRGVDREVPENIGKPHSTAIAEVLKVMVQWLGEHDLAHFFREDVNLLQFPKYKRRVKTPMSLSKIRDQLKEGYYAVTTETGMRCFLQDLSLIESNCIRFNGREPGISRSAATLSSRSYLFYQSHIELLAAKLGFPHMLSKSYINDGRIWVADRAKAAGRGCGDQNPGNNCAVGGTGDKPITISPQVSVSPRTSSRRNLTESMGHLSISSTSHAQNGGILSTSAVTSFRGASAESSSDVDPFADAATADNDQGRNVHTLPCYVCGRSPHSRDQGYEEEVVFCRECPRKACLSCHMMYCPKAKEPTADQGERERGRTSLSVFWLTRCLKCMSKADSKAPVELDKPSSATPPQALANSLDLLQDILDRGIVARHVFDDVDPHPYVNNHDVARHTMTLAQMLKKLDHGEYELSPGGPDRFIQDLHLTLHDCRSSNVDDSVAFRCARIILAHGERISPMHGEMIKACPEPPRKISKSKEMNDVRGSSRHLGSRVSGTTNVSGGGVSRDSKASSDGVRITRSNGGLRSITNCRVHTKPDEVTSERKPIGADIRREKRPEQHENDDRSGNGGFDIREIEQALSFLTLRKVRATPTSVRQQADASTAAAAPSGRPTSTSPEASTAAFLAGSTRLEPQFETDRDQSGADIRERFSEGQIVWVFHRFAADMPPDGWMEEEMHVPGVVTARNEAVGTSPTVYTIDLFGRDPAVVQETADRISMFPLEGDLDSARSAVTHGLRPERGGGINYLNMVVAQAMMTCIDSGWNSTTGANIYHKHVSPDDSYFNRRIKEYGRAWGVDSTKLKRLMRHVLQVMGHQKTPTSGHDSRILGVDEDGGIGDTDSNVGSSDGCGGNSVDGVKDYLGAAADDASRGGVAWTQAGSRSSPDRPCGPQDTSETRPSAMQASADDMLVDATCDSSNAQCSAAEKETEPPVRSPPFDGKTGRAPTDERIKLPPRRNCFDTPPPFNERDFEGRLMNPDGGNQGSLLGCSSLRGRQSRSIGLVS